MNYDTQAHQLSLEFLFDADFAGIFELRGTPRKRHKASRYASVAASIGYRGEARANTPNCGLFFDTLRNSVNSSARRKLMWCRNAEQVAQGVLIPLILLVATIACSRASSNADGADAQFVANASSGGMAEVKLGQLAEERGASQEVKNFGHKMVDDHRASGKKLQMTASKEGMTLSNDLSQEDRATYDKLSKLSGAEFDRAYAADMVKDHQHEIAEFEKEAKYGKDPAVRQFAQETLPTLREHLQLAEKMERGISAASGR